jgi:hypothetical protein
MKNKVSQLVSEHHPLVQMRNPMVAHEVLNRCGFDQVRLCICCWNHEKVLCPYRGNEPAGACPSFVLDEANIEKTEKRIMDFLATPQLLAA